MARLESCCATRTSLERAEIASATQIENVREQRREEDHADELRRPPHEVAPPPGRRERARRSRRRRTGRRRSRPSGTTAASALPISSSSRRTGVVSTGSSVPCSRSPMTAYAGDDRGQDQRHRKNVQARPADGGSGPRLGVPALIARTLPMGMHDEEQRQRHHRADHELVAAEVAQLLREHGADAPVHRAHLHVLVDQLEVDVLQRVLHLGDAQHVARRRADQRPGEAGATASGR